MITFFLFLFLLDIQKPPKPESPFGNFVVNSGLDNSALTGCTMSPSAGGSHNVDMIHVDWVNHDEPYDEKSAVSRLASSFADTPIPTSTVITSVRPAVEPVLPDPCPDPAPPTAAVVPEPPTAAILTVSGIVLLYLLFGRRKKERLYRRS